MNDHQVIDVGDTAVYLTIKGRWLGYREPHWRLVVVLRVHERFESHEDAALWYQEQRSPLPSNGLVRGNPPIPYEHTVQDSPWET